LNRDIITSSPATVTFVARLLSISCSSAINRAYLIRSGHAVAIVDGLTIALDVLPVDSIVNQPVMPSGVVKGKKGRTPVSSADHAACVASLLQCLWLLLRYVPPATSVGLDAPMCSYLKRYIVAVGAIEKLSNCFDCLRGSPSLISFSPLLHMVLAFLETITADERFVCAWGRNGSVCLYPLFGVFSAVGEQSLCLDHRQATQLRFAQHYARVSLLVRLVHRGVFPSGGSSSMNLQACRRC
jgi:hypothetical protein